MENFPKVYHLRMVYEENILRLTVTVRFQTNMSTTKTGNVLSFFSVNKL